MTQEHPITPPPDLVRHWSRFQGDTNPEALWLRIANEAAQWGADQELEACLDQLQRWGVQGVDNLRNTRRPKPPSLKEQALQALDLLKVDASTHGLGFDSSAIRRALESLPD